MNSELENDLKKCSSCIIFVPLSTFSKTSRSQCSTTQWSSPNASVLWRNNWVTRGMYTLVHFTAPNFIVHAQDSTRCHAGRSVEQPKIIIETVLTTLDTPDIPAYITKIIADMRQAITNHQAALNMVMMCHRYHVTTHQQRMFRERSGGRQHVGFFGISGFAFWRW